MASQNDGYWSRSWALLTRDKGWVKPLLVLSAANMIPIIGQFGANGYALEWGRLTAWGVDAAPKQKGVSISGCIKSGARAFVVALGYGLAFGLLRMLLGFLLRNAFGGLISFVLSLAFAIFVVIASLRATIYQSIGAGYEIGRIADMIKRDWHGLLRVLGMVALMAITVSLVATLVFGGVMLANMGDIMHQFFDLSTSAYVNDWEIALLVMNWIGGMLPYLTVVAYGIGVLASGMNLLTVTAVALWMRQYDVAHWGESSDPLPATAPGAAGYGAPDGAVAGYGAPDGAGASYASGEPVANEPYGGYGQVYPTAQENWIPAQYDPATDTSTAYATDAARTTEVQVWPLSEPVAAEPVAAEPVAAEPAATEPDQAPTSEEVSTFRLDDFAPATSAAQPEVAPAAEPAAPIMTPPPATSAEPAPDTDPAPAALPKHPTDADFTLQDAIAQTRTLVDADLTEPVAIPMPAPAAPTEPAPAAQAELSEPESIPDEPGSDDQD